MYVAVDYRISDGNIGGTKRAWIFSGSDRTDASFSVIRECLVKCIRSEYCIYFLPLGEILFR